MSTNIDQLGVPEDAAQLYETVEAFRRGGEGFTFQEWSALSQTTKNVFVEVGNKLRKEQAALVSYFMAQPIEMVRLLFGEEAAMKMALEDSMESAPK